MTNSQQTDIVNSYKNGVSLYKIKLKYNTCYETIKKILSQNNIQIRDDRVNRFSEDKIKEIIDLYTNKKWKIKDIAIKFVSSEKYISNILKKNNIKFNNLFKKYFKLDEIKDLYFTQEKSLSEIGKIYGCNESTIWEFLTENNIKLRTCEEADKLYQFKHYQSKFPIDEIVSLYISKQRSIEDLCRQYGCSNKYIRKVLVDRNIPIRTSSEHIANLRNSGHIQGRWKKYSLPSGKVINIQGYEDKFLDYMFKNNLLLESDFQLDDLRIPYIIQNKNKTYIPDFYIPKYNLILEIKGKYIYNLGEIKHPGIHKLKKEACIKNGFKFLMILDNDFSQFIKFISETKPIDLIKISNKSVVNLEELTQTYENNVKELIKYIHTIETNIEVDLNTIYIPVKNIKIKLINLYLNSECNNTDVNSLLTTLNTSDNKIKTIQIFEDEWINKKEIVKSRLNNLLGLIKDTIYARKCEIKEVSNEVKNKFLNKYHIQGQDISGIRLGAYYKNQLVSVMTFGKNHRTLKKYSVDNEYELIRFCSINNFNIIGIASKLLKHFEKTYKPQTIVSYADKRWSTGNLYHQLGFNLDHESKPNYYYTKDYLTRFHRFNFRKNVLKDKLRTFDPLLTEWRNMLNDGWDRIWDCGNYVFIKDETKQTTSKSQK